MPQAGDTDRRQLDSMLEAARRECTNMQAKLTLLQREREQNRLPFAPAQPETPVRRVINK